MKVQHAVSDEREWDHWLDAIVRTGLNLTTWEEEFVESIRERRASGLRLSDAVARVLERIYAARTP